MDAETVRYPGYRWVVLGAAWLTMLSLNWFFSLTPSLAYVLVPELGLNHMQSTLIFTAPILVAIFFNLLGGALGDHYGIRLTVGICAVLAGVTGLSRAFVTNFGEMFLLSCLFGIGFTTAYPNLPKLVAVWFPRRQAGLATGIYLTSSACGGGLGLLTAPLFGGWRPAFLYTGIFILAAAVLWIIFGRSIPKGVIINAAPMTAGIKRGIKNKNIWILALSNFLFVGATIGLQGNFPEALEMGRNISPQAGGAISSLLAFAGIGGNILIPVLSDKVGLRKPFIYVCAVASAVFFYLAWHLAPGVSTWVLIFLGGFIAGGIIPILYTVPLELPELSREYIGGATGLTIAFGCAGGFFIPLLVISPLMSARTPGAYTSGFLAIALLFIATLLPAKFLMETGVKAKSRAVNSQFTGAS